MKPYESLELSSALPEEYREDVETLLYFNSLQGRARTAITFLLEKYGAPRVYAEGGLLKIDVGTTRGVQTLFAVADHADGCQLVGVVMFVREGQDLVILHLAVAEAATSSEPSRQSRIVLRLVRAVRDAARRVKGIGSVLLYYPAGVPRRLAVVDRVHEPVSTSSDPMYAATVERLV